MPPETSAGKGAPQVGSIARRPQPDGPVHVWQHGVGQRTGHDLDPLADYRVPLREVEHQARRVTARTAYAVGDYLRRVPIPAPDQRDAAIRDMDNFSAEVMSAAYSSSPFFVWQSVGGEGFKDDADAVIGEFGIGVRKVATVNDPVEGSKAAMARKPGAISVLAASTEGGLIATPRGIKYMNKRVGPKELNGLVHLDQEVEEYLGTVADVFNVDPSQIDVIMLKRPRNAEEARKVLRFGSKIIPIEAGDLMAGLEAATNANSDNPTVMMGIGGYEEGIITAAGAKVLGASIETEAWSENPELMEMHSGIMTVNDMVPGDADYTLVNFTAITYEPWFGISGVMDSLNGHSPNSTVTISRAGIVRSVAERV